MIEIFDDIKKEIICVEEELRAIVSSSNQIIRDSSVHMINAGGKRLRPALTFLSGKFYNYDCEKIMPLAVAIELIHMATLVHDDVVDSSMTRRNIPTVKSLWGNKISTHLGDYLFGKSLKLISGFDDFTIAKVLADTSVKICEGEIQQLSSSFRANQSLRDYFYRIKRKTALLIAASSQLGAVACGAPESIYRPLRKYGIYIGMAFQITDDMLDLVSDNKQLGKPVGVDLKQGILTLPVLFALKNSPFKDRLAEILKQPFKGKEEIGDACRLVVSCGGIDYASKMVQRYVDKAKMQLRYLPAIPARETLLTVAEFINDRKS